LGKKTSHDVQIVKISPTVRPVDESKEQKETWKETNRGKLATPHETDGYESLMQLVMMAQ